jgi:hypothetical protein
MKWAKVARTMNINRVLLFCVLFSAAVPNAPADDPFHNVYHTLKRFFIGDDKHASTASQHRHPPLKHSHAQSSPGEPQGNSSEPRTVVLPEATPFQDDRAAKPEDSKAGDLKAGDLKAGDLKAAETKPRDTRPAEVIVPSAKSPEPTPTANPSPVLRSVP